MVQPLISICVPAYKRTDFLKRLLQSIAIQSFKDFELIITDDSPGDEVKELCLSFQAELPVLYFKNTIQLGTPENWNAAIRHSSGEWIKLMHDDDWFTGPDSLANFAGAIDSNTDFIYSAFNNVWLDTGKSRLIQPGSFRTYALRKNPVSILSKNIIGPPSVTMHRRKDDIQYDRAMKWLVDMDFYIRYLATAKTKYIDEPLVSIGIHGSQVTVSSQLNPEVEIPEHIRLLEKTGTKAFRNILFYDAWWRLLRNLQIKDINEIRYYSFDKPLSPIIGSMVRFQQRVGLKLLRVGALSKFFMFLSYTSNLSSIK